MVQKLALLVIMLFSAQVAAESINLSCTGKKTEGGSVISESEALSVQVDTVSGEVIVSTGKRFQAAVNPHTVSHEAEGYRFLLSRHSLALEISDGPTEFVGSCER